MFDASNLPDGVDIQVQAVGHLPVCRRLISTDSEVVVQLQRVAGTQVETRLTPAPPRPLGRIHGLPGSDCSVDVTSFRLDQTVRQIAGELRFGIEGIPPGDYWYEAAFGAPRVRFSVPGPPIIYQVPGWCLTCL